MRKFSLKKSNSNLRRRQSKRIAKQKQTMANDPNQPFLPDFQYQQSRQRPTLPQTSTTSHTQCSTDVLEQQPRSQRQSSRQREYPDSPRSRTSRSVEVQVQDYLQEVDESLNLTRLQSRFFGECADLDEPISNEEKNFMKASLSVLEISMQKLKEYFLLRRTQSSSKELFIICKSESQAKSKSNSNNLDVTPSTSLFFSNSHSIEFYKFVRVWQNLNHFYEQLSLKTDNQRRGSHENDIKLILNNYRTEPGFDENDLLKFYFEAGTLEQACYVAEQKVREVFGFYKLIITSRLNTKQEAIELLQNYSIYPAKRVLIWANEFYLNEGRFTRY